MTSHRALIARPEPKTSCRRDDWLSETSVNAAPRYQIRGAVAQPRTLKTAINSISGKSSDMEIALQGTGISYSPHWMDELYSQKNVSFM